MIFRFFHSNDPICFFLLIPIVMLLQIPIFFVGTIGPQEIDGYLSLFLKNYLTDANVIHYFFSVAIILMNLYLIQKISSAYKLLGSYSHAISLLFCFVNALFIDFISGFSSLIAEMLLLLLLYYYLFLFERAFSLKTAFNIGLILGLGMLFYKPFVVFVVLVIWGVISFRSDLIRVGVTIALGFFIPFYFLFTYQYLMNIPISWQHAMPQLHLLYFPYHSFSALAIVVLIVLLAVLIQAFIKIQGSLSTMLIFNRNIYGSISLATVLIFISLFLTNEIRLSALHLLAVPMSFILAYLLKDYKKKWIPELYFWTLFSFVILNDLFFKI